MYSKPEKQIESLRGQRAANENEMSDMHVSFRKYANERNVAFLTVLETEFQLNGNIPMMFLIKIN